MEKTQEDFETVDIDGGRKGYAIEGKSGEKEIIPGIAGGTRYDTWPFRGVLTEMENFHRRYPGESDDEIESKEPSFRELHDRYNDLYEEATSQNYFNLIDYQAASIIQGLDFRTISDLNQAFESLEKIKERSPEESPELEGILDDYIARMEEEIKKHAKEIKKVTAVTEKEKPEVIVDEVWRWIMSNKYPGPQKEEHLNNQIVALEGEKFDVNGVPLSKEEFQTYVSAQLNFQKLWKLVEAGAPPTEIKRIFASPDTWGDDWFGVLFESVRDENGHTLGEVVNRYLKIYEDQDSELQDLIKANKEGSNDEKIEEFIKKKMLIRGGVESVRKETRDSGIDSKVEEIGYRFVNAFFSSSFDRGVILHRNKTEPNEYGESFHEVLWGNTAYNNRFIDHSYAFMTGETKGRVQATDYFGPKFERVLNQDRIERELMETLAENKDTFNFADYELDEDGQRKKKFSETDWSKVFGKGGATGTTFFVVFDDREKTLAMHEHLNKFFQSPNEKNFVEVIANYRSSRPIKRDRFVKEFTENYIDFMRHERKATFDLRSWDTHNVEKFILQLKESQIIHDRAAGELLRKKLGASVDVVTPVLRHIRTPIKRFFPNSGVAQWFDKAVDSKQAKFFAENFHLPGWWWVREIRKYFGGPTTWLRALWEVVPATWKQIGKTRF